MPTSFSRSLRSLEADRFRWNLIGIVVGLGLLTAWLLWLLFARVALYEVADRARLEVDREPHTITSLVPGRVVENKMTLGLEVKAGDVLLQLDVEELPYQLDEERAKRSGLEDQRTRLRGEFQAQERALRDALEAGRSAVREATARAEEARVSAETAEREARRQERLHEEELIPESEVSLARAEADQKARAAEAAALLVERVTNEHNLKVSEKRAELSALERRASELDSSIRSLVAVERRREHQLSLYRIEAPVDGRIGDLAPIQVGEVIDRHQHLGTILPSGQVRVVAEFSPRRALGRVTPGQRAKLRLEGFSWVQYGSVPATVVQVAGEPSNGTVRVELSLDDPDAFPVPLEHGLPGVLEVEVERISPAELVLRAAGNVVSRPVRTSSR